MIRKISFTLLSFFLAIASVFAQSDPTPVSSPQRGTTYAADAEVWYSQPFIWIGVVIAVLIIVLLMLRGKGKTNVISKHNT